MSPVAALAALALLGGCQNGDVRLDRRIVGHSDLVKFDDNHPDNRCCVALPIAFRELVHDVSADESNVIPTAFEADSLLGIPVGVEC